MTNKHQELENAIQEALKKIGSSRKTDICHYIPADPRQDGGIAGYKHHFTFSKEETEEPEKLKKEIEKFILQQKQPHKINPKPRIRTPRRRKDQLLFSKHDIDRLLQMARMAGDKEMVRKLTTQNKDLKEVKKELISSIRRGQLEPDLWNTFVELVTTQQSFEQLVHAN